MRGEVSACRSAMRRPDGARTHLDTGMAKAPSVAPKAVAVFGGAVDPANLRFPDNNPAMRNMAAVDLRDWDAIRAWADTLPCAFGLPRRAGV